MRPSSADLHPPFYQFPEALQMAGLVVLHPPKWSASLLPRCEIWIIRIALDMNIHLTTGGKVPILKTLSAVSFCSASSPYLLWGPFQQPLPPQTSILTLQNSLLTVAPRSHILIYLCCRVRASFSWPVVSALLFVSPSSHCPV